MKTLISTSFALLFALLFFISENKFVKRYHMITGVDSDTIEYFAKNYVLQPNDKLEDLLKRMPDIHFVKTIIYAQGDTVKKLLVDGMEYFSEDPTIAAKTIRADKVNKIQIYWRWSDQANFTGVPDNVKVKTMNAVLKK